MGAFLLYRKLLLILKTDVLKCLEQIKKKGPSQIRSYFGGNEMKVLEKNGQVIEGNFEEKEETDSEAVLTAVEDSKDFQDETNTDAEKTIEPEIVEEEKLPTVEDNLRNIAKIVEEEQDQLKIIEERTGEFKLDFGQKKSEEQNSLIDEIDDNMSLDELMSLYEKKFKD